MWRRTVEGLRRRAQPRPGRNEAWGGGSRAGMYRSGVDIASEERVADGIHARMSTRVSFVGFGTEPDSCAPAGTV